MHQEKKVNLEKKVMGKIKKENITPRSPYIFVAKKLGLSGGFALSIILAILFLNIALFSLKSSGNLEFLSMGKVGFLAFLESFPYYWVIIGIGLFVGASALLTRYDISYKKPFKLLVFTLLLLIIAGATALLISGVNEKLEKRAVEGKVPFLQIFYRKRKGMWRHGLIGRITQIQNKALLIQTPQGKKVTIEFTEKKQLPSGLDFKIGDIIRTVGKWQDESFLAFAIRQGSPGKGFGEGKAERRHNKR